MIAAIWAQTEDGLIGNKGELPWHLPADLAFFKQMTEDNTIVMGKTTFEGMGKRVLPNRQTIVLTTDMHYQADGVIVMHSIEDVLSYAENFEGITFIAGGSKIYEHFLQYSDVLYKTVIEGEFEGDAYFPAVNWDEWSLVNESDGEVNDKNKYPHHFDTYHRKS